MVIIIVSVHFFIIKGFVALHKTLFLVTIIIMVIAWMEFVAEMQRAKSSA